MTAWENIGNWSCLSFAIAPSRLTMQLPEIIITSHCVSPSSQVCVVGCSEVVVGGSGPEKINIITILKDYHWNFEAFLFAKQLWHISIANPIWQWPCPWPGSCGHSTPAFAPASNTAMVRSSMATKPSSPLMCAASNLICSTKKLGCFSEIHKCFLVKLDLHYLEILLAFKPNLQDIIWRPVVCIHPSSIHPCIRPSIHARKRNRCVIGC